MKYMLKITCFTPKGKAESCSKSFAMKYFDVMNKPVETKVVSDTEFYYVYEYPDEKKRDRIISKKIPKANETIRLFYQTIIHLVIRGNKLAKDGAWAIEKTRRWIMKQLRKKVTNPKEYEDFINAIELSDKEELMAFLYGDLFKSETWEV